jgi:ABC-type multidrug transport system fused ATPase/permease subunit
MAFQGIFLMGAFCAAMKIQPRLHPDKKNYVQYQGHSRGAEIEVRYVDLIGKIQFYTDYRRNLSYTYPGSKRPALSNVNFKLEAGETLAIVGYNGSGTQSMNAYML